MNQGSDIVLAAVPSILRLLLALAATSASAQLPVVGYLWLDAPPTSAGAVWPFVQQLKSLGQLEGRTYVLEARYASGDNSRFPGLARQLLDRRPTVIVAPCGPALRAIRQLSSTVPVIAPCADPRNFLGEVADLNRPGGRTTGLTFLAPESAAKRLHLLKELQPKLSRVGILHHRHDDWGSYLQEMDLAAVKLGVAFSKLPIERAEDLDDAFAKAARQRLEALVVFPDATTVAARTRVAALAIKHRLPTVFDMRVFVFDGGLLSYGPDWSDGFAERVIATYIDKILKGADPAELPIQQPTRLELVINLQTARALGLNVPHALRVRADKLVE